MAENKVIDEGDGIYRTTGTHCVSGCSYSDWPCDTAVVFAALDEAMQYAAPAPLREALDVESAHDEAVEWLREALDMDEEWAALARSIVRLAAIRAALGEEAT